MLDIPYGAFIFSEKFFPRRFACIKHRHLMLCGVVLWAFVKFQLLL